MKPVVPSSAAHSAPAAEARLAREVRCPTCQKLFIYGESPFRPFCSERCRMIDLGRWFKEEYTVAAVDQTPPPEDQTTTAPIDPDGQDAD